MYFGKLSLLDWSALVHIQGDGPSRSYETKKEPRIQIVVYHHCKETMGYQEMGIFTVRNNCLLAVEDGQVPQEGSQ